MTVTIARLVLAGAFFIIAAKEENIWKVVACALAMTFAISVVQFSSRTEGYKDATCDYSEGLVKAGKLEARHVPEFCDD